MPIANPKSCKTEPRKLFKFTRRSKSQCSTQQSANLNNTRLLLPPIRTNSYAQSKTISICSIQSQKSCLQQEKFITILRVRLCKSLHNTLQPQSHRVVQYPNFTQSCFHKDLSPPHWQIETYNTSCNPILSPITSTWFFKKTYKMT